MPDGLIARVVILALPFLLLVTACGGHDSVSVGVAPMWQAQIDAVMEGDPSDLESSVLADYDVTDAEYRQARQAYKDCMSERGVTVKDADDNGYTLHPTVEGGPVDEAAIDTANDVCEVGTVSAIEPIYFGMRENPQGLTFAEQLRECYTQNGIPDGEGLSGAQFEALVTAEDYHASTPEGLVCFWDPTGAQGITVDQAAELDRNRVTEAVDSDASGSGN